MALEHIRSRDISIDAQGNPVRRQERNNVPLLQLIQSTIIETLERIERKTKRGKRMNIGDTTLLVELNRKVDARVLDLVEVCMDLEDAIASHPQRKAMHAEEMEGTVVSLAEQEATTVGALVELAQRLIIDSLGQKRRGA